MKQSYELVCGAAFEDLSQDEMQMYDGGGTIATLSTTTWLCIGASAIVSLGVSLTAIALSTNVG